MLKNELTSAKSGSEVGMMMATPNTNVPSLRTGNLNQNSSKGIIVSYEVATVRNYGE